LQYWVARSDFSDASFRETMTESIKDFVKDSSNGDIPEFLKKLHYSAIDTKTSQDYGRLKERIEEINAKIFIGWKYHFLSCHSTERILFYSSVPG
jgi:glucose-6-phosphate 1-dehydrogenase